MRIEIKRLGVSALFALLWSALAVFRPTSTFHLAPLLVAAWPALAERDMAVALRMSIAGLVVASVTTGALSMAGLLEGPSLLPRGDAAVESLAAALAGAAIGMLPAIVTRRTRET